MITHPIWRRLAALAVIVAALPSCSVNILEEFGDPFEDKALLFDAREKINSGDYTGAIASISLMSADFKAQRDVKLVHASAYAGVCGVDFLSITEDIADLATTRLFPWLLSTFPGGTAAKEAACKSAETIIHSIATLGSSRTADENLLMAFVGLAKMSAILGQYADTVAPIGTVDPGYDPCATPVSPDPDFKHIATGFNIAMDALENIGGSTIGADGLADITSVCADLTANGITLCGDPPQVDIADISTAEEDGLRTLINEDTITGLGSNCTGDVTACACP